MRDILLTVKRQRTELFVFAACFLIAFLLNVISIITFDTEWKELYTQLLWVVCLALLLYGVVTIVRLFYWGIKRIFKKG